VDVLGFAVCGLCHFVNPRLEDRNNSQSMAAMSILMVTKNNGMPFSVQTYQDLPIMSLPGLYQGYRLVHSAKNNRRVYNTKGS